MCFLEAKGPQSFIPTNIICSNVIKKLQENILPRRNVGGRPSGTTLVDKKKKRDMYVRMMNFLCKEYAQIRLTGSRVSNNKLETMIEEAKKSFGVSENVSYNTIKSRYRRNRLICNHRGTASPMETIEPAILEIAIMRGRMNQPLTVAEGLLLANSLIKPGSKVEKEVMSYLDKRGQFCREGSPTRLPGCLLGIGYWSGFRRRHEHRLTSKKGVQFGHNRSEWCTHKNFKTMYSLVYEAMEVAGVARKLPQAEWRNERDERVSSEAEAVGRKVEYEVTHPDHMLYVDEVGNNTCQKEDGNKGGGKYLTERCQEPRNACSTSDAHWTCLGFTAGTGEPVLCVIIFAAQGLTVEERLGIDVFAPIPQENNMFHEDNYGKGKYFPGPPKCHFRGKEVPCYVTHSPKGSITSTILTDVLRHIDRIDVFPRGETNPTPFLLLDGHGSRLEVPFLSYVNNPAHKWVVCIGVPNGTSIWQVGDSPQQNGCYKMYSSEYKKMLTSQKIKMGIFKLNLTKTDIVPIVNYAWERSFARVATNLKAVQERGWGPLNQALLLHPQIASTNKDESSTVLDQIDVPVVSPTINNELDLSNLNMVNGFAGDTLCSIIRRLQRDEQTMKNLQKSKKEGTDFISTMKHVKKWSAGIIFDNNKCHLDEEVLQIARSFVEKKAVEFWKKVRKHHDDYFQKKTDFDIAHRSINVSKPDNLPIKLLKPLCAWKKRKGDKRMPTKLDELNVRWVETKDRRDISLEEYFKTNTTLFDVYQKENKGKELTIELIDEMMKAQHDVDTDGAAPIVEPAVIVGEEVQV